MAASDVEINAHRDVTLDSALIADDDPVSLLILQGVLGQIGIDTIEERDGDGAWKRMQEPECPPLIVLDWMMPGMTGPELCKKVRALPDRPIEPYVLLLTSRSSYSDVVEGLNAGADDYLAKPFDREELKARIRVGQRIVRLQLNLRDRIRQVQVAHKEISTLRELIPICMYCKKVCSDDETWQQVELYVRNHAHIDFTHKICPDCLVMKHPEMVNDEAK